MTKIDKLDGKDKSIEIGHDMSTAREISETLEVLPYLEDVNIQRWKQLWYQFDNNNWLDFEAQKEIIDFLWDNCLLWVNTIFDWKVNRWIAWASIELWFKNLLDVIKDIRNEKWSNWKKENNFRIEDMWPWDWTLINEINKYFIKESVEAHWVWDKIYIDFYNCIKESLYIQDIPEDVVAIFIRKLIWDYLFKEYEKRIEKSFSKSAKELSIQKSEKNFESTFFDIIKSLSFDDNQLYRNESMFCEETQMFSVWKYKELSDLSKEYLESLVWKHKILELKRNFYKIVLENIKIPYKKIFISDFTNYFTNVKQLNLKTKDLSSHLILGIRSISHLNNKDYKQFIENCIEHKLDTTWVILDDWICRSYSAEMRINELFEIKEKFSENINIYVIISSNNKIKSVIIEKWHLERKGKWEKYLNEWHYLIDING